MSVQVPTQPDQDAQKLEMILAGIDRLPTLPSVATRLLSVSSAEDVDLDEIIQLIESDPAMSTTILKMCRSADKGLGDRITTVRRAVIMLGLETVQVAALSVHVYQQLQGAEQGEAFDFNGFWVHSLTVACGAESIARAHPALGVSPEEAYLAGLLHDLGKVALDLILPQAYERVLEMASKKRCALCLIERTMLGLDHHTAGKRLAEHWGLPEPIRDAIWLNDQPPESVPSGPSKPLVTLITLAESWARDLHLGWSGDFGDPLDPHDLANQIGIDPGFFKNNTPEVIEAVSHRGEILGLSEHTNQDLLIESLTGANRRLASLNAELRTRASLSDEANRVLEALDEFIESLSDEATPEQVFQSMVRSAAMLMGSQRAAVIFQHSAADPWRSMMIDQGEVIKRPTLVQVPGTSADAIRPAQLAESGIVASLDLSELDWLRELFSSVREVGMPLLIGSPPNAQESSPSYLIVMPRIGSTTDRILSSSEFQRVRTLWSRSLAQSISVEQSKRVGEELASANHALNALRNELTSKESLVQLGRLAAGAAHEMNNPLSVILGRSQQLFERVGSKKERDISRSISESAQQLSDLISSLRMIADPPKPQMQDADPVLLVREAIEIARQRCHTQGIRARVHFKPDNTFIDPVTMDISLLAQAIAEPIINAIQSEPHEVVTVSIEPDPAFARLSIRISDQGRGFSEDSIRHAFDPFYSELPAGRRSGLGLSRARGLVELHRGEIELGNRPGGEGGLVIVHLPTTTHAANAA
jgi:putative nucleotidyltransferase with HDIG domain